jgi:hypothetical protein
MLIGNAMPESNQPRSSCRESESNLIWIWRPYSTNVSLLPIASDDKDAIVKILKAIEIQLEFARKELQTRGRSCLLLDIRI